MPADSVWVWLSALVLYDFCYYWAHRCGHEIGLFWAAHVVHHQSEAFNLSTALRQTSTGTLSFVFYLPMALLGWLMEGRAIGRWLEFGRLAATPLLPALAARCRRSRPPRWSRSGRSAPRCCCGRSRAGRGRRRPALRTKADR